MVPPKTYFFTIFTGIYGVFAYFEDILTFLKINLDIGSRGSTIYIYNRGCRQTCET